jgi:hypothetical protein
LEREANSESELDDDTVAAGDYRNASGSWNKICSRQHP